MNQLELTGESVKLTVEPLSRRMILCKPFDKFLPVTVWLTKLTNKSMKIQLWINLTYCRISKASNESIESVELTTELGKLTKTQYDLTDTSLKLTLKSMKPPSKSIKSRLSISKRYFGNSLISDLMNLRIDNTGQQNNKSRLNQTRNHAIFMYFESLKPNLTS